MMERIERRTADFGAAFVAFESGIGNHDAHAFFDRAGFAPVSTNFAKILKNGDTA